MTRDFIFIAGALPSDFRYAFSPALFNSLDYRSLHSAEGWRSFYLVLTRNNAVHGHVHFHISGNNAESPLRAPFGSFEFSSQVPIEISSRFLDYVVTELQSHGVADMLIKNPPGMYYDERSDLLEVLLLNKGFTVSLAELTSVISVTAKPFIRILHPRKKRKLAQSRDAFCFRRMMPEDLPDIYGFISGCRLKKKYELSVTLNELSVAVQRFPHAYELFAVLASEGIVAASVVVKVKENIMYHFISDHIRKVHIYSPVLILMEGIYNFCFETGIQFLDLGTSTAKGLPDSKLMRFKSELGASAVSKFTFRKSLA